MKANEATAGAVQVRKSLDWLAAYVDRHLARALSMNSGVVCILIGTVLSPRHACYMGTPRPPTPTPR